MAGSDDRFSLHASLVELGGGPLPDEDGSVCGGVGHCRNIVTPAVCWSAPCAVSPQRLFTQRLLPYAQPTSLPRQPMARGERVESNDVQDWVDPKRRTKRLIKDVGRTCRKWGLLFPIGIALVQFRSCYIIYQATQEADTPYGLRELLFELFASCWTNILAFCATFYPIATVLLWCRFEHLRGWVIPNGTAEACTIFLLWNTHLVTYTVFNATFATCMELGSTGFRTYTSVLSEYFFFVTFVPSPTCVLIATGGHWARRFGKKLGFANVGNKKNVDTALVTFFVTLPLAVGYLYHRYTHEPNRMIGIGLNTILWLAYFFLTYPGNPQSEGSRQQKSAINSFSTLFTLAHNYFSMHVMLDKESERVASCRNHMAKAGTLGSRKPGPCQSLIGYDPGNKGGSGCGCILGFHPHGIIPYTAGLGFLHPRWQHLLPGLFPHYMTDSFIHSVPGIRDGAQILGAREVSRENIRSALQDGLCTMIVPGGQVEIFTSESTGKHVVLTRKHKGFIRLALLHGATLVPVLSMGEWILLDNVKMSYMQGIARAYLGFPIPFIPYGSFICMPRRSPITIIIGEPLVFDRTKAKPEEDGTFQTTESEVLEAHKVYFDRLREMFDRNKKACGFPDHKLVFDDEISAMRKEKAE
jgi:1-acyl-sn-glycerol-3-phosphate acyltransferase